MLAIAVLSVLLMLGLGFAAALYALADLDGRYSASQEFDSASSASTLQTF